MKVLNLYAGLGGNRKLWEGVEITSVEYNEEIANAYKSLYPEDTLIIGDAHEYLLNNHEEFDFIWSSPPCQSHSRMVKATRHKNKKYPDMKLYEEIIFLDNFHVGPWIIENVKPYYKPLVEPTTILGRHYVWSNIDIPYIKVPELKNFINSTNTKGAETLKNWLGIKYDGNIYYENNHCPAQVLRNCVHPDLGLHIFKSISKQ